MAGGLGTLISFKSCTVSHPRNLFRTLKVLRHLVKRRMPLTENSFLQHFLTSQSDMADHLLTLKTSKTDILHLGKCYDLRDFYSTSTSCITNILLSIWVLKPCLLRGSHLLLCSQQTFVMYNYFYKWWSHVALVFSVRKLHTRALIQQIVV